MLHLLEGEIVKLPSPRNIYSEDIVAIFPTSKSLVKHRGPSNAIDDREIDKGRQMEKLQVLQSFSSQNQDILPSRPTCFAKLVFFD